MPKVLNKYKDSIPKNAIYIGRPSKWGNPFAMKSESDRETVVERYCEWILERDDLMNCLDELRGKDLVCFCAPKLCHGDVLLELANA